MKANTGKRFRRKGGEVFVPLFLPNLGLARPLKRAFRAVLFPRWKSIAFRRSPAGDARLAGDAVLAGVSGHAKHGFRLLVTFSEILSLMTPHLN